ncbi:DUF5372 family protein [Streptomyces sp. Ag109_O5-1]|uniref:DUF5372 family protein n=1 Tax=Streptomyces sp. Ag109_O5-1 TaxID=1938851 RepID=UPI000F4E029F|nr:DUF5372 family protein [Streptomyces sp. Ag109_O5-1]
MGSLTVTHPFHALSGQRLEILFVKRRSGALVFVCAYGVSRSVTLPQEWTDRGGEPSGDRLGVEGLSALGALVNALVSRGAGPEEGGS